MMQSLPPLTRNLALAMHENVDVFVQPERFNGRRRVRFILAME
jgi:hypothetical protein